MTVGEYAKNALVTNIRLIELHDFDKVLIYADIDVEIAGMVYTLKSGGQKLHYNSTPLDYSLAYGKQLGCIQQLMTTWNIHINYGQPWRNVSVYHKNSCDEQTRRIEGKHGNIEFNDADC